MENDRFSEISLKRAVTNLKAHSCTLVFASNPQIVQGCSLNTYKSKIHTQKDLPLYTHICVLILHPET